MFDQLKKVSKLYKNYIHLFNVILWYSYIRIRDKMQIWQNVKTDKMQKIPNIGNPKQPYSRPPPLTHCFSIGTPSILYFGLFILGIFVFCPICILSFFCILSVCILSNLHFVWIPSRIYWGGPNLPQFGT